MRRYMTLPVALLFFFAAPGSASAQAHVASVDALDELVAEHATAGDADRAELRAFLARPAVADIAARAGIDIVTVRTAAAMLGAEEAREISLQVGELDTALAGGDTVVISTTAIIIGLLILILVLVI